MQPSSDGITQFDGFMEFFAFFVSNYPFGLFPGRRHDTTGALLIP